MSVYVVLMACVLPLAVEREGLLQRIARAPAIGKFARGIAGQPWVYTGMTSQNTKPSRVTISPVLTATGRANIGPAQAKVWNSPFSAQGSTPAGRSASRPRSKRRPAKVLGNLRGSTQVT